MAPPSSTVFKGWRRFVPQTFVVLFLLAQTRRVASFPVKTSSRIGIISARSSSILVKQTLSPLPAPREPSSSSQSSLFATASSLAQEEDDDDKQPLRKKSYEWNKKSVAIALPALVGMLVDPLLSLMDTAYVGRVGSTELAALGACTSIFHLAFNAFRATTAATTSLVATSLESEDAESAKEVTAISLQFGWWVGMAVTVALLVGGQAALAGMGVTKGSSELYPAAADYLFTRSWAAPVVLLIVVSEGVFRGYGNTVVPLTASLVAAAINLVLDPLLMFKPIHWGVKGAAAATALSQVGAAAVYGVQLVRRGMLPSRRNKLSTTNTTTITALPKKVPGRVIRTILEANAAMLLKQGSLLLGWAYATARATRLGAAQVAAHQVALSVWLVFALLLDATAVSAQVLMSRTYAAIDKPAFDSLMRYMLLFAVGQGLASMVFVNAIDALVPRLFTPDPIIQGHLHLLMRPLAFQQLLVSLTLVVESLAVGANQFRVLAGGTALATVFCVWNIAQQTTVTGIWSQGITILFAGRLVTAVVACVRARSVLFQKYKKQQKEEAPDTNFCS
jgi:putative MATE family efflux protein